MATVYKLTDENDQTHGGTQWGENVTHEAPGTGDLCTDGWVHSYDSPLLAVLLNPSNADFAKPHLWEAEASGAHKDDHGLKRGDARLTTIQRLPLPEITTAQRVRFAILCANTVLPKRYKWATEWRKWAEGWLSGKDRSAAAAYSTAHSASAAASAAAHSAAAYAERAAYNAAAAERAAYNAAVAAERAAYNAAAAAVDLIALAEQAVGEEQS